MSFCGFAVRSAPLYGSPVDNEDAVPRSQNTKNWHALSLKGGVNTSESMVQFAWACIRIDFDFELAWWRGQLLPLIHVFKK
jgi:hypothetical protein